jgi:hypothetical protein
VLVLTISYNPSEIARIVLWPGGSLWEVAYTSPGSKNLCKRACLSPG